MSNWTTENAIFFIVSRLPAIHPGVEVTRDMDVPKHHRAFYVEVPGSDEPLHINFQWTSVKRSTRGMKWLESRFAGAEITYGDRAFEFWGEEVDAIKATAVSLILGTHLA